MSHAISLAKAVAMTQRFRQYRETILHDDYKAKDTLAYSETFDVEAIRDLIADSNCAKVRIYYGMDNDKKVHAIMVGVDANDEDILPSNANDDSALIVEQALRCPTICPTASSVLNS